MRRYPTVAPLKSPQFIRNTPSTWGLEKNHKTCLLPINPTYPALVRRSLHDRVDSAPRRKNLQQGWSIVKRGWNARPFNCGLGSRRDSGNTRFVAYRFLPTGSGFDDWPAQVESGGRPSSSPAVCHETISWSRQASL
jgi:hypothetical protein